MPLQHLSRGVPFHYGMVCGVDSQEMVEGRRFRIDAHPDFPGMKVLDDSSESADVVAVSVGQGNHVKMIETAEPEIRRDNVFAKIKFAVHRADAASTIN